MLYQYIQQKWKKIKIIIIILIIFIMTFFIFNYCKISEPNFYYYLFSSIIQGFLALVGVLGTAVVYRLQLIENDLNSVRDKSITRMRYYRGAMVDTYSWIETKSEMESILRGDPNDEQIKSFLEKINKFSEDKGQIRNSMIHFLIIAFSDVSMAILGIPLSTIIFLNNWHLFGVIFSIINISLSIYLLVFSFKIARKIFGYSFVM